MLSQKEGGEEKDREDGHTKVFVWKQRNHFDNHYEK